MRSRRQFFVAHRPGLHIPCPRNKDLFFLSRMFFLFFKPCSSPFNLEHATVCHKKAGRSKNGQKNRKNAQRKHHSSKKNISTLNHFDGFLWKMLGKRWRRGEKKTEKTDPLSGSWGWDAERAVFPMLGVGLKGLPRVVFLIIGFPQYCIPSRGTNMHLMAKENSSSQPPVKNVSSQVYTRVLRRCIGSNFGDVTRRISPNVCSFIISKLPCFTEIHAGGTIPIWSDVPIFTYLE